MLEWKLTLQNLVEFLWNSHGTLPQSSPDRETLVEPSWNHAAPLKNLVELWWNPRPEHDGLVEPWWQPGGTLVEPYLKPPRTTLQPSQNLVKPWLNSGGNLVEPSWNLPQTRPPQPLKKLLEPWWNPCGILPQTTPDHPAALVEPSWNLASNYPDHPAAWNFGGTLAEPRETFLKPAGLEEIGGTLVEPSWNLTSNHPRPPRPCRTWSPGGTLVEPWWNPGGPLVGPWWNPGGTLVEPWWNPGGTLVKPLVEPWWNLSSGSPRTTPEPIWAETPKLSAAGEKRKGKKTKRVPRHQTCHKPMASCSDPGGKRIGTLFSADSIVWEATKRESEKIQPNWVCLFGYYFFRGFKGTPTNGSKATHTSWLFLPGTAFTHHSLVFLAPRPLLGRSELSTESRQRFLGGKL